MNEYYYIADCQTKTSIHMAIHSQTSLYTCSDKNLHNKAKMWEYFVSMKRTFCTDFVCVYIWVPTCPGALVKARGSLFSPSSLWGLREVWPWQKNVLSFWAIFLALLFPSYKKQANKKEPGTLLQRKDSLDVPNQQNCYLTSSPDSSDSSATTWCRKNYRYTGHRVKENRHEVRGIIWEVTSVRGPARP